MKNHILFIIFILAIITLHSQNNKNIDQYFEKVYNGQIEEVKNKFPQIKKDHSNSPYIILLEALFTEDGKQASELYLKYISSNIPNKKYFDLAYYKLFQYYFANENFSESDKFAKYLLKDFPDSKYSRLVSPAKKEIVKEEEPIKTVDSPVKFKTEEKKVNYNSIYTIQVGAFAEKRNAENLKTQLLKYGSARIVEQISKEKTFYVVLIGNFDNINDGIKLNSLLLKELNLKGTIINNK